MIAYLVVTHLLCAIVGGIICWTYACGKIREVKADALRLLRAPEVDLSPEDAIRRAGC